MQYGDDLMIHDGGIYLILSFRDRNGNKPWTNKMKIVISSTLMKQIDDEQMQMLTMICLVLNLIL